VDIVGNAHLPANIFCMKPILHAFVHVFGPAGLCRTPNDVFDH